MNDIHVGILNYGVGNISSIANAIARLGYNFKIIEAAVDAINLSHLIIPGVGSFGYCKSKLVSSELFNIMSEYVAIKKTPTLGICVGMQLMLEASQESPGISGFGWFQGTAEKIKATQDRRVPHVGWNSVEFQNDTLGFKKNDTPNFYFDHSFAYKDTENLYSSAVCEYSEVFAAVIEYENIVGVQFHPEKSQRNGLKLLENFLQR